MYNLIEISFARAERPVYTERKGMGMVNFGEYNNYPTYLNDLFDESPKHGAIIKSKVVYIYGNGLSGDKVMANPDESINDLLKKCILDDEKYGGYCIQIIWGRNGKIASMYHMKYHKVRTNGDNTKFWVKDEWDINKVITQKDKLKERSYPAFDITNRTGAQILFVKNNGAQQDVYPMPSYVQALNYIEADRLMSRHVLGMAKDGFVASKLINFNNGEPTAEQKKSIEDAFGKKFTGSEGKKFIVSFNKNTESQVTIADLGTSQLTKEDFTNVNNLIQQEIFASHQVTSPMLFGIKTEGQLGGRSELKDAYEIFKNTYVNERQQVHEEVFNGIISLMGLPADRKIIPVEPLGIDITPEIIASLALPKKYFLDKLGIDLADYEAVDPAGNVIVNDGLVNDNLKNLTGRQFQNITRIVKQYGAGKITRPMAIASLRSGFGLSEQDIIDFLGEETQTFSEQDEIKIFESFGEKRNNFILLKQYDFNHESDYIQESFAAKTKLDSLSYKVLEIISKDKLVTPETIADALNEDVILVRSILTELVDADYIKEKDGVRTLTKPLSKTPVERKTETEILVRYSYEWKSEIPYDQRNTPAHPSRAFCKRIMELDRFYTRGDIQTISARVGYSVWDRRGGWWTMPDGVHSPSCRHEWKANVLLKKK
jgi:hypothetical protein